MKYVFSKILFSLIVFTYVFSSVGICLVAHYCDGSLEKVALFSKATSCCEGEDTESDDDCCSDDSKHVSFQKDFTFSTVVADYKIPVHNLFKFDYHKVYQFRNNSIKQLFLLINKNNHPPNLVQEDIILSSVLRI